MPDLGVDWSGWPIYLVAFFCGYLLGNIPIGFLARSRAERDGVVRNATLANILNGAKIVGAACLGGYVIAIPFVIAAMDASYQSGSSEALMQALATRRMIECAVLAGGGALLGHLYPVWRGFKRPRKPPAPRATAE